MSIHDEILSEYLSGVAYSTAEMPEMTSADFIENSSSD
jgi:hypothetical protein